VVGVLVGGDDGAQGGAVVGVADEVGEAFGVGGGVDQQCLVGGAAHQQVGVVVHGADRDLGDGQLVEGSTGGWTTWVDVTGVVAEDLHDG
jgi:hypothetical protein